MDNKIVVSVDLRRILLEILHFGHAGTSKILAEAKVFYWPEINRYLENKLKNCTECLASDKSLRYKLPNKHY